MKSQSTNRKSQTNCKTQISNFKIVWYLKFLILVLFGIWYLGFGNSPALASITFGVVPADSYAWGENIGWINFDTANGDFRISENELTGFAWSSNYGWINFKPTNGGVTNNCDGELGGHAWSASLGWIPFSGVTINEKGKFTGTAGTAGSIAGRINFDCANCNVTTDWLQCRLRTPSPSTSTSTPTPTLPPSPTTIPGAPEESPSQLFDIALIIDDPLIEDSRALSARVTFTSFGTEDTPVDMEFIVLDDTGKELYTTSGKTVIQTEGIYNQTFKGLVIPDGKYTLTLKTLYGGNVRDEFRQSFEVRAACTGLVCVVCNQVKWAIPLELMLIVLLIIRKLRRKELFHA